jgi:hypothetical protein
MMMLHSLPQVCNLWLSLCHDLSRMREVADLRHVGGNEIFSYQ